MDIDVRRVRIAIIKERRINRSTGEEKIYKRYRGYFDLKEKDVEYEWVAIKRRELAFLLELYKQFNKKLERTIMVIINKDTYPVLYKALSQYEERYKDAWKEDHNAPKIYGDFLKKLLFGENGVYIDLREFLNNKKIRVDDYKIRDDIAYLCDVIEDEVHRAYKGTGLSSIWYFGGMDYDKVVLIATMGRFWLAKEGCARFSKRSNDYVLKFIMNGKCSIENTVIA